MADFQQAFDFMLPHEGQYVSDPTDPGSETKYGISKRSYPKLNIKNLTVEQAAQIYERDFWEKIHGGKIQDQALANKLFDLAVNMGVGRAIRLLQEASGLCGLPLKEDGVMGTQTLTVINMCNSGALLLEFKALASSYYRELAHVHPALQRFLGGWLKRAAA
ncbi:MAG TPA: glycosyl hydrolase 108 family protein [Terriglobales bacterium]|jgi:lysozyme family protein|nr:glycosyl hydrolase 108 family protein [Terriglobales bacterium]